MYDNRQDNIQFIRDDLNKESLDDIILSRETHSSGYVQGAILRLWSLFQKEYARYSLGNLTINDHVCQFIRKLDGKERFLERRKSKLLPSGDGPFQGFEWINDNAYKLDLPSEYNVSATFNASDLSPFDVGVDLRTNPLQEEGNDEIKDKTITSTWDEAYSDLIQVPVELVIRA